ncbi:MAG: DUF6141 family protein [Daejeonella sp.]
MDTNVLFSEKQYFRQTALWLLLIGLNLLVIYAIFQQLYKGEKFGQNSMTNLQLIIFAFLIIILTILFKITHLNTLIKQDGIYTRFFPFQLNYKKYTFNTIKAIKVGKYNPILEYGGWGLRVSITGKRALNISGNKGIQLFFNNGLTLLIGTNKQEDAIKALKDAHVNLLAKVPFL